MSDATPNLSLPYILPDQAQKHVTHNEAILALDALVHLSVGALGVTEPPTGAGNGERFIVGEAATGAFAGHDGRVAQAQDGGWRFLMPRTGWIAHDASGGGLVVFDGTNWTQVGSGAPDSLDRLGINTSADVNSRLSINADSTLLSHEGGGHRLTVNKAGPAETASLLYQSDWSGRAEMGLTGSDDFVVKTSADGALWTDALRVEAASARVTLPAGLTTGGEFYARKLSMTSNEFPYYGLTINNDHPSAVTIALEFLIGTVRRCSFGVNENMNGFGLTMFDPSGAWRGSPIVVAYAGAENMNNALYIAANSNIGINRSDPATTLDINGVMRLEPIAKASLPVPDKAGMVGFASDAAGGAQLVYCDGTSWLKVRDGLAA